MSRAAFTISASNGAKTAVSGSRSKTAARAGSAELPEHVVAKAGKLLGTRAGAAATATRRSVDLAPASRLELLLLSHPRKPQPRFQPVGEGAASQAVNRALKLASQWTDVQAAIESAEQPSAGNLAYALNRLGCIASFASRKRRQELAASGLAASLLARLQPRLGELDAGSLVLLLDGCARLRVAPPKPMLEQLAARAWAAAASLDASQLPLVLWAFGRLSFVPRASVLAALEAAAAKLASALSPQGLTLCLQGLAAAGRRPAAATLRAFAARLLDSLASFKPSELAACLAALSATGFEPPPALLQALAARSGTSVHTNTVSGKRPLGGGGRGGGTKAAGPQPAAALGRGLAAAEKLLQQAAAPVGTRSVQQWAEPQL